MKNNFTQEVPMNAHSAKKTFLSLLLILSLCLDIAMTAHAGEYPAQSSADLESPGNFSSASDTSPGDMDENDSSDETAPDGSSSDKDNADTDSAGDGSSGGNTAADNDSSADTSSGTSSGDDSSEEGFAEKNTLAEDAPSAKLPADEADRKADGEMDSLSAGEAAPEMELTPSAAESETTFITLSAAGDCTLGIDSRYSHNFNKYYKKKGDRYFLKKVSPIFSQDDITIVNFEGTLTSNKKRARKTFTFKGPKKYVSILKKGSVEVVNLANNHSKDYGKSSLTDTQSTLRKNNIGYCRSTVISYQTVNDVKMAFLGFNALERITKSQIRSGIVQAKKNKAKIIVVSFHWGVERKYYPNAKQKSLGRYAIDCGASLVLGHHPHVLQGIEKYNGRYIVYSLGNFCFGGNSNPKDKDTMIFQQKFSIKGGKLQPENNAKIIPCSLSSHKKTNDFQPRILSGSEKKRLIKKMNKLSRKLKVSISSSGKLN